MLREQPSTNLQNIEAVLEGGASAWLINGLLALLVVLVLALPPISLPGRVIAPGYTNISRDGGSIADPDGTQLSLKAGTLSKDVKVKMVSVPRLDLLQGNVEPKVLDAAQNLPPNLAVKSPLYQIYTRGQASAQAHLSVPIPNDSEPYKTLDLYSWTGREWAWIPHKLIPEDDTLESDLSYIPSSVAVMQTAALKPRATTELNAPVKLNKNIALAEVNPRLFYLQGDGSIGESFTLPPDQTVPNAALIPVLHNMQQGVVRSDLTDNLLIDAQLWQHHIDQIVTLLTTRGYPGIEVDYSQVDPELRGEFSTFITELAKALHEKSKKLSVRVDPPRQIAEDRWETGAYDWVALGLVADNIVVPALQSPQAYVPGGQMEALLSWAVGQVDRYKLRFLIPTASYERSNGIYRPIPYDQALASVGRVVNQSGDMLVNPGQTVQLNVADLGQQRGFAFDPQTQIGIHHYRDSNGEHTIVLQNAATLSRKLGLLSQYHIGGVSLLDVAQSDPRVAKVIAQYQAEGVAPLESRFAVVWRVQNAAGEQIAGEVKPVANPAFAWTAPSSNGQYTVRASLSDDNGATTYGAGSKLALVIPSPTPTPIPPTPTPRPTATPKPKPKVAAASGGSSNSPAPAPRNTNFGYGIQAHLWDQDLNPIVSSVKGLGFNWVKQQVEWKVVESVRGQIQWGEMDRIANTMNANGINVMFSIVKAPKWARPPNTDFSANGPPADPQTYADFVGQVAKRYCGKVQAYEVWNEQNLWYEWGGEPLDAGRYIELLKRAYASIKANCSSAIVISGALTPAGDVGGRAVDDMNFLEQMYQHGLKNYSDAIGAHPSGYNVPPDADWRSWSDPNAAFRGPSDNHHHSWVFRGTMEGYRNIMVKYGDSGKRVWATEFGWASSASPVANYEYASDNTPEEQARWTAQAYQMAKSWGWVGVMFLWNLNFKVVAPGSEQAMWGIVTNGWQPTQTYAALANMPK